MSLRSSGLRLLMLIVALLEEPLRGRRQLPTNNDVALLGQQTVHFLPVAQAIIAAAETKAAISLSCHRMAAVSAAVRFDEWLRE